MVSKSLYLQRDAAGLCVRCGGPRKDTSTKQCGNCINGAKIKRDNKKTTLATKGLCILCGDNKIEIKDKYCKTCHDKKREVDRKIYKTRVEKKQCVKCQKESQTPYCSDCSAKKQADIGNILDVIRLKCYELFGKKCVSCNEQDIMNLMVMHTQDKKLRGREAEKKFIEYAQKNRKLSKDFIMQCAACYRAKCIQEAQPGGEQLNTNLYPQLTTEESFTEGDADLDTDF